MPKLIVTVKRLRDRGWLLPRHRIAFQAARSGILDIRDHRDPEGRTRRLARLLESDLQLMDPAILFWSADQWILEGTEEVQDGLNAHLVVQTWLIEPVAVESTAWQPPD